MAEAGIDQNPETDTQPEDTTPNFDERIESIFQSFGGLMTRDEIRQIFSDVGGGGEEKITSGRPPRPVVSQGRASDEEIYNGPDKSWAQRFAAQHDNKPPTWEDRADAMWGAHFAQVIGHGPTLNDWRMHYYVKYDGADPDTALKTVQDETKQPYHASHPVWVYSDTLDPSSLREPKAITSPATAKTGGAGTGGTNLAPMPVKAPAPEPQRALTGPEFYDLERMLDWTGYLNKQYPLAIPNPNPDYMYPTGIGDIPPIAAAASPPPVTDTTTAIPRQPIAGAAVTPMPGYVPMTPPGNPIIGPDAPIDLFGRWLRNRLGRQGITFD